MFSSLEPSELGQWLNQFEHPLLIPHWADTPGLLRLNGDVINIKLPFYARSLNEELENWIDRHVQNEAHWPQFQIDNTVKTLKPAHGSSLDKVKNIIAVTSAKGGVGKSTTAVNLALALQALGAKVGLLDADIYGPSIPLMLGTRNQKPEVIDNKWMKPVLAHGLQTHSIGYLVDEQEAAVWRGPMASKALMQILQETLWQDLDYLIIDMPPGTGDIQLTLAQQIPVTAALVVTTPQDLALADAIKGVNMFEKVSVPVVGVVENMSYHICSQCGHHEAIFGEGGAEKLAEQNHLTLLAQIPLHISLRQDIDSGKPTVVARPESDHSQSYLDLAEKVASLLFWRGDVEPESIAFRAL